MLLLVRLQATKYVAVSQWTTDSVDGWNLDNVDCANDCNTAGKCRDIYIYTSIFKPATHVLSGFWRRTQRLIE